MSKCRYDLSEDCNNIDCLTCVLDKIKAEINAHKKELKTMAESDDWYAGKLRGQECDIEIIDKYRAESEE